MSASGSALLEVENLSVEYGRRGYKRQPFQALKSVSLAIAGGECLGLVGESGSGKTTLGRVVLGLATASSGSAKFDGVELVGIGKQERRLLASEIQVVFQDPYTSLNPAMTIGAILSEPLVARGEMTRAEARSRVMDLFRQTNLPETTWARYPNEFSGGQRQRIAIARALALKPRLIVCDEPVSALDVSTQRRILDLLIDVQRETGVAMLFISHDLAAVRRISHRICVIRHGEIVESGGAEAVTSRPEHPYTKRLLMSAPIPDPVRQAERRRTLQAIKESNEGE